MCVHVYSACEMPDSTLVWVDRRGPHTLVYVAPFLSAAPGTLSAEGVSKVNEALITLPGAPSLETAKSCQRQPR